MIQKSRAQQQKEELYRLLEAKQRLAKVCPIAKFVPTEGQQRIIDVVDSTGITLVLAGNRFGKTHTLVAEIIAALLGYRPWLVENFSLVKNGNSWDFPHRSQIPPEAWVYRKDGLPIRNPSNLIFITGLSILKGVGSILQPKWYELWPKQVKFKPYFGPAATWIKVEYQGSTLAIAADTQDPSTFEGAAYDRAFGDEPMRKAVFTPTRRGLIDQGGSMLWAMTPVGDAKIAWITRDLILNKVRTDVKIIEGSGSDNPHIDQKALQEFLDDPALSEDERDARAHGKLGTLGKRIVSTFKQEHAVIPSTDIPPTVPRMLVADPHHSKPCCMIWVALMSQEHWIIYREYPTEDFNAQKVPNIGIKDLAGRIKTEEGKENVVFRVCDPQFGRQHGKNLGQRFKSFQEEMAEYDLLFDTRVDNDLERGIRELRDAFRFNDVTGRPKIQIFNTCMNTIQALELWAYHTTDSGLKVSEEMKDMCDCVRYGAVYNPPLDILYEKEEGCYSYLENEED